MEKEQFDESSDYNLQIQYWAYVIATHYNISLAEVYAMPRPLFQQSFTWAMVVKERQNKREEERREEQRLRAKVGDREIVKLDYNFLEDFD